MISGFTLYDTTTAPAASPEILEGVQKFWGVVPNLHGVLAESPAALEAYSPQAWCRMYTLAPRWNLTGTNENGSRNRRPSPSSGSARNM